MDDHRDSADDEEPSDHHTNHDGHHVNGEGEDTSDSEREEPRVEQLMFEEEAEDTDEAEHEVDEQYEHHVDHEDGGHDHGGMRADHEQMFRHRFFVFAALQGV